MRRSILALSGCLILLPTIAAVRSSSRSDDVTTAITPRNSLLRSSAQKQLAAAAMPDTSADHPIQHAVRLSDTLGSNRALTSFSSFARQGEAATERLGSSADHTTVLAPLNSAFDALPGKPWENAREVSALGAEVYEGAAGKDRADANLRRFVEAHLVTQSPWPAGTKAKTVAGTEVWWEERDGKRVVMPDNVEVDKVAIEVGNGQLVRNSLYRVAFTSMLAYKSFFLMWLTISQWIIKGVLKSS